MSFKYVLSCSILAVFQLVMVSVDASENSSDNASISVREFIDPDGRFDLDSLRKSGYQGELDLTGLNVQLDSITGEPIVRTASMNSLSPVPDDVFWDNSLSNSIPGVNSTVFAMTSYKGKLIVGGKFTVAGDILANKIAAWDGSSWSTLGTGVNNTIRALTVFDGNLIVGGTFTEAGGIAVNNIASWDGSTWSPLGEGVDSTVLALTVYDSNIYAGGLFDSTGSVEVNHVAMWNGSVWSALGTGTDNRVYALAVYNNELVLAGRFVEAGGLIVNHIASWNGVSWSSFGSGLDYLAEALYVHDSLLFVGGWFAHAGGISANRIASWNGTAWSPVGSGLSGIRNGWGDVRAITFYNGNLIASGNFNKAGGGTASSIASWDGSSWDALGSGVFEYVQAIAIFDGRLVVGGKINLADGKRALNIVNWNGSNWSDFGTGTTGGFNSLIVYDGLLIAGGSFEAIEGTDANFIAAWDGSTWSPLGTGINGHVYALAVFENKLIVGGVFSEAGGVAVNGIAAWDGTKWSALGGGLGFIVYSLAVYDNKLYAGSYGIYSWDGTSWSSPGTEPEPNGGVRALTVYDNRLIVAGNFGMAGNIPVNLIAAWDGSNWSALESGVGKPYSPYLYSVYTLTVSGNALIAGGYFFNAGSTSVNNIASWDGASWSNMGTGHNHWVNALTTYDNKVIAGGNFFFSNGRRSIASWDGASWNPLGSGTNGAVYSMFPTNSVLFVGGGFNIVGADKVAGYIAKWTKRIATGIEDYDFTQLPTDHKLAQNYPNPFNPETVIEFELPRRTHVRLSVFNVLGQEVAELLNEEVSAGSHRVTWNGKNSAGVSLASGIYFYRIVAEDFTESKKMILIK